MHSTAPDPIKALERSRTTLAADLHGIEGAEEGEVARAVGSVHIALNAGLTQQWLVDPEHAPSAEPADVGSIGDEGVQSHVLHPSYASDLQSLRYACAHDATTC
ncbi:hypothetical protein [Streptomyces sp. 5-6(2022)]|uniref:hypothetical protein n=1 Tax=Streptomyces sp. 5-6(2022) TaxID=2936510 RepID=UPI0023B9B942|nr:hypothetical protein [Streptomyces sp. 5-6(2022)]